MSPPSGDWVIKDKVSCPCGRVFVLVTAVKSVLMTRFCSVEIAVFCSICLERLSRCWMMDWWDLSVIDALHLWVYVLCQTDLDLSLSFSCRYSLEKDWVFCSLIKPLITWIMSSATSWKLPYYPQRRAALHPGYKHVIQKLPIYLHFKKFICCCYITTDSTDYKNTGNTLQ